MVKTKTLADLSHVDGELARANERLDALRAENSEKDTALRKVQEVQRLTNNQWRIWTLSFLICAMKTQSLARR